MQQPWGCEPHSESLPPESAASDAQAEAAQAEQGHSCSGWTFETFFTVAAYGMACCIVLYNNLLPLLPACCQLI